MMPAAVQEHQVSSIPKRVHSPPQRQIPEEGVRLLHDVMVRSPSRIHTGELEAELPKHLGRDEITRGGLDMHRAHLKFACRADELIHHRRADALAAVLIVDAEIE